MSEKPEAWTAADSLIWPHLAAKFIREKHAENERLREALEMIAGHRPCVIDGFKRGFMPGAEIAKAALRREEA